MEKKKSKQLCWYCKNAVPNKESGCSWSRNFEPVKNWTATKSIKNSMGHKLETWHVEECPQFQKG